MSSEPLTPEEAEFGRLLTEQYPDIARLLLAAADITTQSHDVRKNEQFLLALSNIAATVMVRRMNREDANAYVAAEVEILKAELKDSLLGPQTGPWAQGELPRY